MAALRRSCTALVAAALLSLLAACGGSGGDGYDAPDLPPALPKAEQPSEKEAARFLAQATFGPTAQSIETARTIGLSAWLDWQFRHPQVAHQSYVDTQRSLAEAEGRSTNQNAWMYESFWNQAVTGQDALRQRVAFALSQIFVVSLADSTVSGYTRGVASYLDMLGRNAFGNFRQLIEDVSLHPMMGLYLSHLRNQKADPARGRVPDENYAREVMQLFTIGLHELNPDGSVKLDGRREPIETYDNEDVSGLARVFTGWSWAGPDTSDTRFYGGNPDPDRDVRPMQPYAKFHSGEEKSFLGTTIPAGTDARASLAAALDRLFNHPNVGPFIGKQLIQRLVTSNPSPSYVARVAAAFDDDGGGRRGDMRAVIRAVLLDPEARSAERAADPAFGRLREPIVRMAGWMRAFDARSASGRFLIGSTDDPGTSLGQTPMRAPSVFNWYRPGYVPPNTSLAAAGLVAPEMQITHESSVAGYLNTARSAVERGFGSGSPRDVQPDYSDEVAIAGDPAALVDRVSLLLAAGQLAPEARAAIADAVASVPIPAAGGSSADTARRNRAMLAVFLTMASPGFVVQK